MLLSQFTVSTSGWVVVLPVLVPHLHDRQVNKHTSLDQIYLLLIKTTNSHETKGNETLIPILHRLLKVDFGHNKPAPSRIIGFFIYFLTQISLCTTAPQLGIIMYVAFVNSIIYAFLFKCHTIVMLSIQRPWLIMHNLVCKLYQFLNIIPVY